MATVWLNGSFVDEENASVSLRDTGLLHAAGVFTTMRSYNGKVFRLDQHLARLRKSCEALFVPLQYKDEDLTRAVTDLHTHQNLTDARLRLTVTRGLARQDPLHGIHLEPTTFLTAAPLEPYPADFYARGMTVILLDEQKLNPYDIQAGHKTLDYFSRLSGLRAANERAAGEALWFNVHNYLQSGSISNVFMVRDGRLFTPPTPADLLNPAIGETVPYGKSNALPGVTRQTIIELAERHDIEVVRAAINVNQILEAQEIFITNTIMQVMPVCRIERSVVGDDRPGAVTRLLSAAYTAEIALEAEG